MSEDGHTGSGNCGASKVPQQQQQQQLQSVAKYPSIVALAGRKQVGKNTAAEVLCSKAGFYPYAFADPLKKACALMFDLSPQQLEDQTLKETVDPRWGVSPRKIFQCVGTDLIRDQMGAVMDGLKIRSEDFWTHRFRMWHSERPPGQRTVITDLRFQSEVEVVHELGGIVILIERDTAPMSPFSHTADDDAVQLHQSERMEITPDYVIQNKGDVDALHRAVLSVLRAHRQTQMSM